ncbi:aminopeptidase Ey-like isoform X1 [Anguilla anguilla]|uniref:aminopeptidase Ey-like isoform X1 n=1 Tax=Anguilla anguilla TaxID=7936 RepID=UPI0015AFBD8A|nr:aminopeptidase Ey-like isoform X1 [Anguilla anguilla]
MSKSVYVSKAAAVATVTVAALALVTVIGLVIFHLIRSQECSHLLLPTVLTTTLAPNGQAPDMRLPGNLIPESYEIYLRTHLYTTLDNLNEQNYNFSGNSTVKFKCVTATNTIYIHSKDLNLVVLGVIEENRKNMPVNQVRLLEDNREFAEIELADTLKVGRIYYLITEFMGECKGSKGIFLNHYKEKGNNESFTIAFIAASKMEPMDARRVFPCFDEPAMKAVFNITIIHRKGSVALSNMPQKDQVEMEIDGEQWLVSEFVPTVKMSTYLLAFTVSCMKSKETKNERTMLRTWARPEAIAAGHVDYAHSITRNILDFLEEYSGIEYPLRKLDQLAVPEVSGDIMGMENWGLIIYAENTFLYDAGHSATPDKEMTAIIIAHELAHQWFGNLVTMRWWSDLWLKEGFATYMSYLAVDKVEPTWNIKDLIIAREIQKAMSIDSEDFYHFLSDNDLQTPDDILSLYDIITYSKGAAVLRMLANTLTESVFKEGVQSFLKAYQYNSAETQDLWSHLQRVVDKNSLDIPVAEVMDTWTEQSGYPLITINTESGEVSQEHFNMDRGQQIWQIPIKVMKSGSGEIESHLLTVDGPVSKPVYQCEENEWIIANVNCTGYYRVNYDPENWEKLLQQLETDHRKIPTLSRAQLIDDAFNLARFEYVNITLALNTTKYLLNDTEFMTWESARENLFHLILMFDRSEICGAMKAYLRKLVGPLYDHFENFTMNASIPDSHTAQLNQINAVTLACAIELPKCKKMATDLFNRLRKDPTTNLIHPNLRLMVYCSAIASGGELEWDFAWEMMKTSPSDQERKRLAEALACTKHVWILNRYLEYTLNQNIIKPEDFIFTVDVIANNVVGQSLVWDFVVSQWPNIIKRFGNKFSLYPLIHGITQRVPSRYEEQKLRKLEEIYNEMSLYHSGDNIFETVIKKSLINIQWVEKHKQTVFQWFQGEILQGNNEV